MAREIPRMVDNVFPLVRATKKDKIYSDIELIGTGFFIAEHGYALTAAHVIDQLYENQSQNGVAIALFTDGYYWSVFEVISSEKHTSEDVGLIKIEGNWPKPIFKLDFRPHTAASEYACFGYPKIVAKEIQNIKQGNPQWPDLIYTQGYIRRRISRVLESSMYKGDQFYELSEVVGAGNSGGPVILKSSLNTLEQNVIAVYIGEKMSLNISYAVRMEGLINWAPQLLSTPLSKM
jgi:S1-C subfamily serine protease